VTSIDPTLAAADAAAQHRRGLMLVAGAAMVWSSGGLLARLVTADSWTILFWRSVFACAFLLGYAWLRNRGRFVATFRELGWPGIVLGLCFATASTCFILALAHTSVANIMFIQSSAPVIAGLLGWAILGERVAARSWLAMAAALAGIALMMAGSFGGGRIVGDLLSIVIAFGFAGAIVTTRRHKHLRMAPATCFATGFAAVFALPFATPLSVGSVDLGYLLLFGAGQMGIGLILFTGGARLVPAAEAALISILEAILAPLWVWLLLAEDPGPYTLAGGAIVLTAIVVHTLLDWRADRTVIPTAD
jgi:drug/metabolite transporter (DMT)-like permease